jgi:Xaa-Pro dipeptidase
MLEQARQRTALLQQKLDENGIALAILTDQSTIAYFAGFWGYLGVEFGRPTFLLVRPHAEPIVVTPLMESEMVGAMTWVESIHTWEDFGDNSWQRAIQQCLPIGNAVVGVEQHQIPSMVSDCLLESGAKTTDLGGLIGEMRMIKSAEEIYVMKQAGEVAGAMMKAAHDSLIAGAPEYESALAVINAGTRKAAGFLTDKGWDAFVSPMIHNLQILQSGRDTSMVHRRASVKLYQSGDPVYFCFCNMAEFKQYKLGFDRMFFIEQVGDEAAKVQQAAIDAQQAALAVIKPGIKAEDVAFAADEVYAAQGYSTGYRTGRSIGMAYLEYPELKAGDKTPLQAGMTFAVDGGISVDGSCGGRIGDSIVVTESGFDYLTDYPRELLFSQ